MSKTIKAILTNVKHSTSEGSKSIPNGPKSVQRVYATADLLYKLGRPCKLQAKTHSEQVKNIFAKLFYFALTILCKLFLKKSTFFGVLWGGDGYQNTK